MKIIFIGTPEYGAIILEGLIKGGYRPVLAVTVPDKPKGRKQILTPPVVKVVAKKHNIPVEQPEMIKNLKLKIKNLKPDLGILAAYGQIIPKDILDIPKFGFLNVHPSLLPKYRGPSPIQFTILNGEKKSGVTIILMDEKIDHGPIISQKSLEIEEQETAETLHNKLAQLGAYLLLETIPKWVKGLIKPKEQDDVQATFTKILFKEDGKIDWKKPVELLEREIRAFYPWPGSYIIWEVEGKLIKIKILKARAFKSPDFFKVKYPIGKVLVVPQNEIGVQCKKDFLVIEKLQPEGKKEMGAEDFLRGHLNFVGTILK
ncbi:MAG: methionyl-tRNA formyltransferase [bacterium]|nr:methionyl-tRNA formyltransferase [bacterium]